MMVNGPGTGRRANPGWWRRHLPAMAAAWALMTVVAMIMPRESLSSEPSLSAAALAHVVLFGTLAVLAGMAWIERRGWRSVRLGALWAAGTAFGALTELAQYLGPFGRSGTWLDVGINSASVAAGCLVVGVMRKRLRVAEAGGRRQEQ